MAKRRKRVQVTIAPVREHGSFSTERVIDVLYPDDTHGRIFFRVGGDGSTLIVDFSYWRGPGALVDVFVPGGQVSFRAGDL